MKSKIANMDKEEKDMPTSQLSSTTEPSLPDLVTEKQIRELYDNEWGVTDDIPSPDRIPEPARDDHMEHILPEYENIVGYVHMPESTKIVDEHHDAKMPEPDNTKDGVYLKPEPVNPHAIWEGYQEYPEPVLHSKDTIPDPTYDLHKEDGLPDSGDRREFSTGSVRDIRSGKGRFDLMSPIALMSIARRMEDGMTKYGERNWEKGQELMSYLDSALRHIFGYLEDIMIGKKSAEDHMSAALWNLHGFIHTQRMILEGLLPAELDDLPTPTKVGLERRPTTLREPDNTDLGCEDVITKEMKTIEAKLQPPKVYKENVSGVTGAIGDDEYEGYNGC
jgi:hypothetical protein